MSRDDAPTIGASEPSERSERSEGLIIVGLGASAGGLGALEDFFDAMPSDSGMAFVVVTHQHPEHPSLLPELLARRTTMTVELVEEPTTVCSDHVYLPAPGQNLAIVAGVLHLTAAKSRPAIPLPIDHFFRSLARDQGDSAVGIVLSGTGSDGTLGLREIKAALGMVMVQEEQSAQYTGMPHSAIATEMVDYVLPAGELPAQLVAYGEARVRGSKGAELAADRAFQQVFVLIHERTGHDFSEYKQSTIVRRVDRRMGVHRIDSLAGYVEHLRAYPTEVDRLFQELLIGVTSFFRDPEVWDALESALRNLVAGKPDGYVLRAWVPACATGEEAYSLAITLRELMADEGVAFATQIFATDLDERAIATAREGAFPVGIVNDVAPERLARFFVRTDDGYRVRNDIREMLVFAPQNVIGDPPFTRLDVILCRNLLIYFDVSLQGRLVPIFHYALEPGGLMLLGASESLGAQGHLFVAVDSTSKLFRRSEAVSGQHVAQIPATLRTVTRASSRLAAAPRAELNRLQDAAERMVLHELSPPTVLVRERGDVIYVHGRTGLFLEPAQGPQASLNIFNMARDGVQLGLSAAIRQAATTDDEVVHRDLTVRTDGGFVAVDVRARRLQTPEALAGLIRVSFDHQRPVVADAVARDDANDREGGNVALLEELRETQEQHQETFEELEAANEELKSANEELQSTNEELQSTNEELETSKEELQSLNEEMQTVNAELEAKVHELSRANNDMKNLLNGTDIGTIFLDTKLCIQRYTEQAKRVIRLIPSDVGRPIADLSSTLRYDRLVEDARGVLRTLEPKEAEVCARDGSVFLMRILPYRTTENLIDGLVLTFIDLTNYKAVAGG